MSNQFVGLTMLVTLSSPPGAQARGVVQSVVPGQSLILRDVFIPTTGKSVAELKINAYDIVNIQEAVVEQLHPYTLPTPPPVPAGVPIANNFEDPAILRMGKRPSLQMRTSTTDADNGNRGEERRESAATVRGAESRKRSVPTGALEDPMQNLSLAAVGDEGLGSEAEICIDKVKKGKRGPRRKRKPKAAEDPDVDENIPGATPVTETNHKAKGWRQTPLLAPNPSFQPFATLKKKAKKAAYDNGWATEDATDVQDLGDFDFAENLSKFDKRTVFEGIKRDDMTADEDRLVGHNRLPKPGTAGGKNFHPTENVLEVNNPSFAKAIPESAKAHNSWPLDSDAAESEVERPRPASQQRGSRSGRTSRIAGSTRADSKLRMTSTKDSSIPAPPSRIASSGNSSKSSFYLVPSNQKCEVVSALQILNLENIAASEFGLTEDMMTENAGRGIAEITLSALNATGPRLIKDTTSTSPYVVIYAGNNKSGARAITAARHLRNHGVNVVACVLGLERESELLETVRTQVKVFRAFGGKVFAKAELFTFIKTLSVPVELIIDGLLGLTISFEELRTGDQSTAFELIEWANRSTTSVIAIDVPTGIDPSSGKVCIIDGSPLYIVPKFVVAMAAPKKGLLEAMKGSDERGQWQLFLADIGIANPAWKKAGTRMRRGVEFEGAWVVGMRFQKGFD